MPPNQVSVHLCRVSTSCIVLAPEQWNLSEAGESDETSGTKRRWCASLSTCASPFPDIEAPADIVVSRQRHGLRLSYVSPSWVCWAHSCLFGRMLRRGVHFSAPRPVFHYLTRMWPRMLPQQQGQQQQQQPRQERRRCHLKNKKAGGGLRGRAAAPPPQMHGTTTTTATTRAEEVPLKK